MIYLTATTDKLQLVTSAAATIDVHANAIEVVTASGAWASIVRQPTAITTATTTDILAAPGSNNTRTLKQLTVRNKDAANQCDVTVLFNANGTTYEIDKVTLQPGETRIYIEGIGFFTNTRSAGRSGLKNVSTADQSLTAAVANYLTGSAVLLPNPVPAGAVLRWTIALAKTGAGTATSQFDLRFGTGGSTSDTSRCSTGALDTETAAADEMFATIIATIRGPIGASCIVQSEWDLSDNLSATGWSNTARKAQVKAVQSSAFDITPAGTIAGISMTPGTADVVTVRSVQSELLIVGS